MVELVIRQPLTTHLPYVTFRMSHSLSAQFVLWSVTVSHTWGCCIVNLYTLYNSVCNNALHINYVPCLFYSFVANLACAIVVEALLLPHLSIMEQ